MEFDKDFKAIVSLSYPDNINNVIQLSDLLNFFIDLIWLALDVILAPVCD